jgi:DNA-binding Lrp family transcriptional regulator
MSVLGLIDAMRADMAPATRLVWQALENHANGDRWWRTTNAALATELHLSEPVVARALQELEASGIIRREFYRRRPTAFYMLRNYSVRQDDHERAPKPDLTPQNQGVNTELTHQKQGSNTDLTPQNQGVKSDDIWDLPPVNEGSIAELTPHDSMSLVPTREESTREGTLRDDAALPPVISSTVIPFDVRKQLWSEGKEILRHLTGQTGTAAGKQIGQLLKAGNENCAVVLDAMRAAAREEPSGSAIAWIVAGIKARLSNDPMQRDPSKLSGAQLASYRIHQKRAALAAAETDRKEAVQ